MKLDKDYTRIGIDRAKENPFLVPGQVVTHESYPYTVKLVRFEGDVAVCRCDHGGEIRLPKEGLFSPDEALRFGIEAKARDLAEEVQKRLPPGHRVVAAFGITK